MLEADLQKGIIDAAQLHGWYVYHAAQIKGHLRSATSLGFPDLVMAHERRGVLFVELKADGGRIAPRQKDWARLMDRHAIYRLWRPKDYDAILTWLATQGPAQLAPPSSKRGAVEIHHPHVRFE